MRIVGQFTSLIIFFTSLQGAHAQGNVPPPGGSVPRPGGAVPAPGQGNLGNTAGQGKIMPAQGANNQGTAANLNNPSMFGNINQNAWFMNPNVQAQLNLNAQQAEQLNKLYSQTYEVYAQGQSQLNGSTNLTEQQRQMQLQAANRFYNDLGISTKDIFDANQRTRFNQLNLQYRGFQAFNDPNVAQRLNLTNEQVSKLQTFQQNYDQKLAEVYRLRPNEPTSNPSIFPQRLSDLRTDMSSQINSVLTPQQQIIWKELAGDPYDFRGSLLPVGAETGGLKTAGGALRTGNLSQRSTSMQPGTSSPIPGSLNQTVGNPSSNPTRFGSINQNAWFMNANVQAHLNLSAQQAEFLNKQYLQHYGVYTQGQGSFNTSTNLTQQLDSANRFYSDLGMATSDIIDANQRARFNQLNIQYRGYQAFYDPNISQSLQLTNDQLNKLRSFQQIYDQKMVEVYKLRPIDPTFDPSLFPKRFRELRDEMYVDINSVLSPEQRLIWKNLVGDPYDFRIE